MKLYDDAYPEHLQIPTLMSAVTDQDYLGAEGGKHAFGYAMSVECGQLAVDSLIAQFKSINAMGRAYGITIPYNMIYIDTASARCSSRRLGLQRLCVATRSNLFDANTIVAQAPCRISRMPDEMEQLRKEWQALGFHMIYHTTMPATSMAELDAYYHPAAGSGFTR